MRRVRSLIEWIMGHAWARGFVLAFLASLSVAVIVLYVAQCQRFEERAAIDEEHAAIVEGVLSEADSYAANGIYRDAIDIYNELLRLVPSSRQRQLYSYIKNNIGICYYNLAFEKNKELNIQKSIIAFRDALIIRTIEDYPEEYADTHKNLGLTYWALSTVRDTQENLDKAAAAFGETLRVYTPLRYPAQHEKVNSYLEVVVEYLNSK